MWYYVLLYDIGVCYLLGFDVGVVVVVFLLYVLGVCCLGVLVISYVDNDYVGGVGVVLDVYVFCFCLSGELVCLLVWMDVCLVG